MRSPPMNDKMGVLVVVFCMGIAFSSGITWGPYPSERRHREVEAEFTGACTQVCSPRPCETVRGECWCVTSSAAKERRRTVMEPLARESQ